MEKPDIPTDDHRRDIWERKLLDFTLRNNLLNLKIGRRVMRLLTQQAAVVEDLVQAGKDLTILPQPEEVDMQAVDDDAHRCKLYSEYSDTDLPAALTFLFRESRNALDESGANTLFLVFGTLQWHETDKSEITREAPLLLLPVRLVRKSAGTYVLRGREEDMSVNTTLLEFVRQQFGIEIKGLNPLPVDDSGYDIDQILASLRAQITSHPRWEIKSGCLLGLFTFSKFVMWNDIHENFPKMDLNPIIHTLVKRQTLPVDQSEIDIRDIDAHQEPKELCVPIPADSSQLSAIAAASEGRSFIMYGPPGTGKSQTITNIIANALYHDRRVLFVAEKAAALQVVQNRLERIGIAPFCLELHSNKATRNHVLQQLQEALDASHTAEPQDFEAKSKALFERRQHLQKYIDALHTKGAHGLSVYDCIAGFEQLPGEPLTIDRACITPDMSTEQIQQLAQRIGSLESVFNVIGSPLSHPLKGLDIKEDSLMVAEKLQAGLQETNKYLAAALAAMKHYAQAANLPISYSLGDAAILVDRMAQSDKLKQSKDAALATWAPEALDLKAIELKQEWEDAKHSFFLISFFKKRSFIQKLCAYNAGLTADNADSQLDLLLSYSRLNRDLSDEARHTEALSADEKQAVRNLLRTIHDLSPVATIELDSLQELLSTIAIWTENTGKARDWAYWCKQRADLQARHLQPALNAILNGHCSPKETSQRFLKAVYRTLAIEMIDAAPELSHFRGPVFEDSIRQYRQLAEEFRALWRKQLYYHLVSRIPLRLSEPTASSEMGKLKRYISSRGRGMTIRRIFDEVPNLIKRLCPCMLMSPISVAQFLSLDGDKFDIVIFDEASQMPTSEAVGTIARGKALVCAGDPKQMPPTSFFSVEATDESEAEYDDMESILDDCRTLSMPSAPLRWHYRSKSESLIAFSNLEYYDGSLYTFPSAMDRVSKVSYVHVDGTYDYGRTRSNKAEAEAIVDEVLRRWRDPVLSQDSIGIIAFSKVQQDLIDDTLSQRIAGNPKLEAMANREVEGIFVKNLENVQGDERDVILFSIGYGPDKSGKVSMNFGPLNNKGGERRLNVAVSRARKEMMVFATLKPEQIDLKRSNARGVEGLKRFLEFARDGQIAVPGRKSAASEGSSIVEAVASEIRKLGYAVDTNVGRSDFKVDIAVVDPQDKDHYLLGILCDGENYYRTKTERDREIVQPGVLHSLGWQLMRLWTIDWFVNPSAEMKRIHEALEKAKQGTPASKEQPKEQPKPEPAVAAQPVAAIQTQPIFRRAENQPIEEIPADAIDQILLFIVSQSISLPEDDLKRSAAKSLGFARNGSRIDQVLSARISALVSQSLLKRDNDTITQP